MGNRGDVLDRGDLDAGLLDRANGGVAAGAGALHLHLGAAQAVLDGGTAGLLGGLLCGVGRALAAALEPDATRRRPGNDVALGVGDGDDRVVERALDVHDARADVLAVALARTTARGRLCHYC